MDLRTETERKLQDLVLDLLHFMEKPQMSRPNFLALMARLRDAKVLLENKEYGCLTGRHQGACHCGLDEPIYPAARPPLSRGLE